MARLNKMLAITLVFCCMIYISHMLDYLGVMTITPYQYQAIFLALLLPHVFLSYPARKSRPGFKWFDGLWIAMAVVPNIYVVFFHDAWRLHEVMGATAYEVSFAIGVTLALLEALRRVFGATLPLLTLAFILHPLFNNHLPGLLGGQGYSIPRVFGVIYFPPEGLFGMPLNIAATIIISFLLFGQFLVASGGGQLLTNLALSAVGRVRGGAAKAAVIGSGLFGTLSGSTAANIAVTGTFTIPMMKKSGFSPIFAGGIEAAAANGGQLMPPVMGAVAFVMADFLGMRYIEVCYVSFIPAIMYYFCMFMQVDFEAARLGLRGLPRSDLPSFRETFKIGWAFFLPVIVLVYSMFGVKYPPELAALIATVSIFIVSLFRKETRLGARGIAGALEATGNSMAQVGLSCAMAGILMASVSLSGVAVLLSGEIVKIAGGNMFILLLLAATASFIFGLGMTALPCYIFVVVMVAPALIQMGITALAAHLFVFWLAVSSFITPPEGVAFFVAAAIAKAPPMTVGWRAVLLGIGNFVIPFTFIYNPGFLLMGSPERIVLDILFVAIGIVPLTAGLAGYLLGSLGWLERCLLVGSSVMIFVPNWWCRSIGVGLTGLIIVHRLLAGKSRYTGSGLAV